MLKIPESMKELEIQAASALGKIIAEVPAIRVESIEVEPPSRDGGIDILAHINVADKPRTLVCEVKSNGQPRNVRAALHQLREYVVRLDKNAVPIFIAPYLSQEAQALCKESNVGFLDLAGNARLAFDTVFIERLVSYTPPAERRELRSLFKPKSAQVLRIMMRNPKRAWRVAELAKAADVSLGHVSNVRTGLIHREWAQESELGFFLSKPDSLLDAWRDQYEAPEGKRMGFYTVLHGSALEAAARQAFDINSDDERAAFASFSAAHWLAPYGRTGTQYFYADSAGLERLKQHLKLSLSLKGENVVITIPKDDGLLGDTVEPAPGVVCTSDVQTYLDLWAAGERGREAAEHLRRTRLSWPA
jgi:Transcriptional regulator, AbiEi antitoxin, Type IV TA system